MTVFDRFIDPSSTWVLKRYLRAADRLPAPKRMRFLHSASRVAQIGIGTAVFGGCGSVLLGAFSGYGYATYPVSPPEYPASMWVFFGVISILTCLGHLFLGWVCLDFRHRLRPFITKPG